MGDYLSCDDFVNYRVKIKSVGRNKYSRLGLVGKCGIVKRVSGGRIGVFIDGMENKSSSYGVYWFNQFNLEFLENVNNESEDIIMEGYKNVAIVNLLEDYSKKDYGFALYDEDFKMIVGVSENDPDNKVMVVVNARGNNNRVLGIVKEVMPIENYKGSKPTAEVVGVVDMYNYRTREAEKKRQAELAKKRAAIEAELEKEINKRKSVEYYEEMAKKYADNPRLAELVGELRGLGA